MTNVIPFKTISKEFDYANTNHENELEVVLIADHEETRQMIKVALGYSIGGV